MELSKIIVRVIIMVLFLTAILFSVRFCNRLLSPAPMKNLRGDGNIIREEHVVEAPFSALNVSGSVNVYVRQDSRAKIEVIADSNLMPYIDISYDEEVLKIRQRRNLHFSEPVKVLISTPYLTGIEIEGAAEINIADTLKTDQFRLDIKGAAMADIVVDCRHLSAGISGAGEIRLRGRAERSEMEINGAGRLMAREYISAVQKVKVNGAGNAYVYATDTLEAIINGAGVIEYGGSPHLIPTIKGIGKIRAVSE